MVSRFSACTLIALVAISGCGGGGGGGSDEIDLGPQPVPGTNGLNYGFEGQDLVDAEDTEITTPVAAFQATSGTTIEDVTITLGPGFFDAAPTDRDATISLFGQTVDINGGEGFLINRQTVRLLFDESNSGTYSAIVSFVSYGSQEPGTVDPIDGEQVVVFGYETDPQDIDRFPATLGVTQYSGGFTASGLVRDDGGNIVADLGTEFDGAINFEIDFNNSRANGQIVGSYDAMGETVPVTLNMGFGNFEDSGFTGTLTCPACSDNTSTLEATFFGPNAEELGGVVVMDTTSDVNGSDLQFTGAGGFVLSR